MCNSIYQAQCYSKTQQSYHHAASATLPRSCHQPPCWPFPTQHPDSSPLPLHLLLPDPDRLKGALQALGLKCGGTLRERSERLWLTKSTPLEQLDRKHFAKGMAPPAPAKTPEEAAKMQAAALQVRSWVVDTLDGGFWTRLLFCKWG